MTRLVTLELSPSQIGPAMTRMSLACTRSQIAGHSSRRPAVLGHVRIDTGGDVVVDGAQHLHLDAVLLHDRRADVDEPLGVALLG